MRVNVTGQSATSWLMMKKEVKLSPILSTKGTILSMEVPPGGIMLPSETTNRVSVGEGTGSCGAAKGYAALVVHAIIQAWFPVLQRTSQSRKVFYTLGFAVTAKVIYIGK